MTGSRLLPSPEAAAYIGVSPSTLRLMRMQGTGPHFYKDVTRIKSHARYRIEDLDLWLASRRFESTAQVRDAAREMGA